ncbi:MAG: molybdopterin molybdotransferase MoeA [Hyphomonadaceae bacterium]
MSASSSPMSTEPPATGLIRVEDALALIVRHGMELQTGEELRPPSAATGLRLAADVHAIVSQPPTAVSAMDGYAVRFVDMAEGNHLKLKGVSRAGEIFEGAVGPGEAVRIYTGAVVPTGADHILIQEDAKRDGDKVMVATAQPAPSSIRRKGLDFEAGDLLAPCGQIITPGALALIGAGNIADVSVRRPPRIGVLATGDELKPAGSSLAPGQIVNSVAPAILSLAHSWGAEAVDLGTARDDAEDVMRRLADDLDVIVSIGGASVGDFDVVRPAFARAGFEPVFAKVAMKPGKPTWFSRNDRRLALGLPGNPAAAMVTANLFLRTLIDAMTGASAPGLSLEGARTLHPLPATGGREEFLRAVVGVGADGVARVRTADNQDSSLLSPFLTANALIRRSPRSTPANADTLVEIVRMD